MPPSATPCMENGYQDTSVAFRSILASCFVNGNTDWLCLGYTDVVFYMEGIGDGSN